MIAYDACTDIDLKPIPATPPMPAQNSWYRDTTFRDAGILIIRATDGNTGVGTRTDFKDMDWGPLANEANPWSPSGRRILVSGSGGAVIPLNFDRANLATSRVPCPPGTTTYDIRLGGIVLNYHGVKEAGYSRLDDNLVFGSDKARYISSYNLITNEQCMLWDTGAEMNGHLYAFSTGAGDDVFGIIGGGTVQDTHHLVAIWYRPTGETHVLDSLANTIDGVPFTPRMDKRIHNARLDLSGRYMTIALAQGGGVPYIWDWQAGIVRTLEPNGGGHRYGGYQLMQNAAGDPGKPGVSIALRPPHNPATIAYVTTPSWPYGPGFVADTHQSWANNRPGAMTPIFHASFWANSGADPYQPGQMAVWPLLNEIYAVAVDGTNKWFRFTYARAVGGYQTFSYQPLVHVSPDGRFVAWGSNWDRSLGANSTGGARIDTFVAKLPMIERED